MFKKENDVLSKRILSTDWTEDQTKKNRLAEKLSKMSIKVGSSKTSGTKKYLNEVFHVGH
jgi:predicted metalloendopeptidase